MDKNQEVAANRQQYFTIDKEHNYNGTLKTEKQYDYLRGAAVERSGHKFVSAFGFCDTCAIEYGCNGCKTNQMEFDCGVGINFSKMPDTPSLKGATYAERLKEQTEQWVAVNPIHNNVDNECCPDFSCCKPHLLVDEDTRKMFANAKPEQRDSMLFTFLGAMTSDAGVDAHICDGKNEIAKN